MGFSCCALVLVLLSDKLEGKRARKLSELKTKEVEESLLEIQEVGAHPSSFSSSSRAILVRDHGLDRVRHLHRVIIDVDGPDHYAGVLSSKLICSLSKVNGHEATLAPECKELLGDSKGSTQVMEWSWFPLGELLEDRLDMLLGLDLLVRQALVAGGLGALTASLHFLKLVCFDVIKINELALIMLQKEFHRS